MGDSFMSRFIAASVSMTLLLAACAESSVQSANGQSSQLNAGVQIQLNRYGFRDVDADTLSRNQIARMKNLNEGQPVYLIRSEIGVILAGS